MRSTSPALPACALAFLCLGPWAGSQSAALAATWPPKPADVAAPRGTSPDVNGDGRVTRKDLQIVDAARGARCGHRRYRAAADLNGDCRVDRRDLAAVRRALGTSVNQDPTAADDVLTLDEDTSAPVPVLANDTDANGDTLTVTAVTQGSKGQVRLGNSGITYAAGSNQNGDDAFTYSVSDGRGGTSTATVTVTITPVNDPPSLTASADVEKGDGPLVVNFQATGSDVDGDALSYSWVFGDGSSSSDAAPAHTFTASGVYTVVATVSDGVLSASQTLTVEVTTAGPAVYTVTTFAGNGFAGEAGEGEPAVGAELTWPRQVAARLDGTVFVVDQTRLLQVDVAGRLTTLRRHAGGDRGPVISVGPDHALYYLEADVAGTCSEEGQYATLRVRRLVSDASDPIVAVVQRTEGLLGTCALSASLAATPDGGFYVSSPTRLFRIAPGASMPAWELPAPGSAIRALAARADNGVVVGGARLIHAISAAGVVTLVAGTGNYGYAGDDGPAVDADLASVAGLVIDARGALTFLDFDYSSYVPRVRRIEPSGVLRTIAGGAWGFEGDGGLAVNAAFAFLDAAGVAALSDGRMVMADVENHRVRVLVPQD